MTAPAARAAGRPAPRAGAWVGARVRARAGDAPTASKVRRLLVVQHDPRKLELLSVNLRAAGFRLVLAGDGGRALEAAQRIRPDAVITDVDLPDMDGFALIRNLRAAGVYTPVLFLASLQATPDGLAGLWLDGGHTCEQFGLAGMIERLHAALPGPVVRTGDRRAEHA